MVIRGEEEGGGESESESVRGRRDGGFLTIDLPRGGKLGEVLKTNQYLTCRFLRA